jgi:hypothetical protein
MKRYLIVMLLLCSSGCASGGTRHIVTVTAATADVVLSSVQDTAKALICATPNAPPPPACIPPEVHRTKIATELSKGFDADGRLAKLIRDTPATAPLPTTLGQLIDDINAVVARVLAAIPDSSFKTTLVTKLGGS